MPPWGNFREQEEWFIVRKRKTTFAWVWGFLATRSGGRIIAAFNAGLWASVVAATACNLHTYVALSSGEVLGISSFTRTAAGKLRPKQTTSTLPKRFKGTNFTSEVLISPDARFLYVANRLHDSIA